MKQTAKKLLLTFFSLFILFISQAFAYDVVVAKDGSGNFTTIQAAVDAAPTGLTSPYTIFIKNGKYKEVVTLPSNKPFLQLIGESTAGTIITYDNYSGKLIPGGGGIGYGTNNCATVFVNGNDCALFNLSIENSTGYIGDGPQAVAVYLTGDRVVFKNCRLSSGQDTLWHNGSGRQYFKNCYIDGNTDFIFGSSVALFDSCVIFGRDRIDGGGGGYMTAANTSAVQAYGEVFRDCQIPKNRGITSYSLGRPWQNEPKTVYLNTRMGSSIQTTGWSTWNVSTSVVTYAEYKNKFYNGTLVDVSQRLSWSKQLTDAEAAAYYNNANLFGSWDPCAVWTGLCNYAAPEIAVSNFRAARGGSNSTLSWNISWPISGVTYDLYRSTDSANYTKINSITSATDTAIVFSVIDGLPAAGTKYFYYLQASKAGMVSNTTDVAVVNVSIPLNGEYRSANSGPWANSVVGTTTLTGSAVSAVTINGSPAGFTSAPSVTFTAAPAGGTTATGTAILTNGIVTGVNITNPGSGYTIAPTLTWNYTGAGGNSVWETYASSTSTWNPVALGSGPSNINITIRSGHTLTLTALVGVASLTIENGGTLNSISNALQGQTQTIRVGNGTAPVTAFIKNDGLFGSTSGTGDGIVIEVVTNCKNLTISGTGITSIARFRPLPGNVNGLNVIIDHDMDFNMSNNTGFTAYYNNSSNTNTEVVTITINPNRTVRVTQPGGGFHSSATGTNQMGTITYNVNGTLDLSTTNSTALAPSSVNTGSAVTMNISSEGLVKLGTAFIMTNTGGTSWGTSRIVVAQGGMIDATKTTTLTSGNNANSGYVVLNGGILMRKVANSTVAFPVGPTTSSYNPVTINNAGTADNFTVNVQSSFDHPVPDANKVVNRQWTINEDVVGGSNATISLAWTTADQAVGFNPASAINIIHYNGTSWDYLPTTISGAGTTANPYVATTTGVASFSPFAIINSSVLPLQLLSFSAAYDNNNVNVNWTTVNEENVASFDVERSVDGRSFVAISNVIANNKVSRNSYNYIDGNPVAAVAYYRLKIKDKDRAFKYSSVVLVNSKLKGTFAIYPNPAQSTLAVVHTKAGANASLDVIAVDGRKMISHLLSDTQTTIDLTRLLPGIYTMVVTNKGEQWRTQFVKQ